MRDLVPSAQSLIDDHFRTLGGVEEVADSLEVPLETLRRAFRREVGIPPSEYLAARRVTEAKRLLATTEMRAFEVGQAVGWSREDTAARAFRREAGMTMQDYRRAARTEGRRKPTGDE
ncbi:MAG: hypothetical protein Rubg2KO_10550 [Rubricoccaceae bacterium]